MFEFRKGFLTTMATHFLIEDYQVLQHAYQTGNWADVQTVMDCLATAIDQDTVIPADLTGKYKPSESSVILPSHQEGVLLKDGLDINCRNGQPVSSVMVAGVCQCDASCPFFSDCSPEDGDILYDISAKELQSLGLNSTEELGIVKGE